MVGVIVGPENRVDAGYLIGKKLGAAVARRVDEKPFAFIAFNKD